MQSYTDGFHGALQQGHGDYKRLRDFSDVDTCFRQVHIGAGVAIRINTCAGNVLAKKSFSGLLAEASERNPGGGLHFVMSRNTAAMLLPRLSNLADRIHALCLFGDKNAEPYSVRPNIWQRGWQRRAEAGAERCVPSLDQTSPSDSACSVGAALGRLGIDQGGAGFAPDVETLETVPLEVAAISFDGSSPEADRAFRRISQGLAQSSSIELNTAFGTSSQSVSRQERHSNLATSIMRLSSFCAENRMDDTANDLMAIGLRHLILRES